MSYRNQSAFEIMGLNPGVKRTYQKADIVEKKIMPAKQKTILDGNKIFVIFSMFYFSRVVNLGTTTILC